jgi:uracil-DNA glycosylase
MRTWRGLYRLLDSASVAPQDCFFTNAYVGLIGGSKPTGRFPGASSPPFVAWCENFLRHQITTMKPAVIAVLGADTRRFVARLSTSLEAWRQGPSVAVHEAAIDGRRSAVVSLAHPSMYPASARNRRFAGLEGMDADAALLRSATRYQ